VMNGWTFIPTLRDTTSEEPLQPLIYKCDVQWCNHWTSPLNECQYKQQRLCTVKNIVGLT